LRILCHPAIVIGWMIVYPPAIAGTGPCEWLSIEASSA